MCPSHCLPQGQDQHEDNGAPASGADPQGVCRNTHMSKKKNTLMQFLEVKINAKKKKPTVNNYQKFKYRHDLTLHDSASP